MKEAIHTTNAPEPVGPYSQAVRVGKAVYFSGQIALNPETGELNNESLEDEAKQIFENLSHVLEEAGLTENDLVRADIFMTDIRQFSLVNEIYETWLGEVEVKPARQTVEVSALPKGASVEVSCIAHIS